MPGAFKRLLTRPWLVLGLAIFAFYGVCLWAPLQYDDYGYILQNPLVTGRWPGFLTFFLSPFEGREYEPLNGMLHWGLYHLVQEHVFLYHFSSLLLHWLNSILLWLIYKELLGDASLALVGALLFGLYPGHVEILALSTFKKHLEVSFCGLALVNLQLHPLRKKYIDRGLAWILFASSLLCKESGLILPVLAFGVGWAYASHKGRRMSWDKVVYMGFGVIAAAFIAMRFFVVPRAFTTLVGENWINHGLTCLKCLLWSEGQLAWPSSLSLEHSLLPVSGLGSGEAAAILLGVMVLLVGVIWLYRYDRIAGCGAAWSCFCMLPFINIIPFENFSLVSNRYLYLASAGFILCAARLFQRLIRSGILSARCAGGIALSIGCAYGTIGIKYAAIFSDPLELWSRAEIYAPGNPRVHATLGQIYEQRGFDAQAEVEFKTARTLAPDYFNGPTLDLALLYARTARLNQAIDILLDQIRTHPPTADIYNNLGVFFLRAKRPKLALAALQEALRLDKNSRKAHVNLGACWRALGRLDLAEQEFKLLLFDPGLRPGVLEELGEIYEQRGDRKRATGFLEASLRLDPWSFKAAKRLSELYLAAGARAKAGEPLENLERLLSERLSKAREEPTPALRHAREFLEQVQRARERIGRG